MSEKHCEPPCESCVPVPSAPVRTGRLAGKGLRENSSSSPSAHSEPQSLTATTMITTTAKHLRPRLHAGKIPPSIRHNESLNSDIRILPSNYSFEVHKTLWRISKLSAKRVALQLPEGLLLYANILCDILRKYGNVETVVLGDVTYGACCIDDLSAKALGCDLIVHYGHSCLVPVNSCVIPALYVFVHIELVSSP